MSTHNSMLATNLHHELSSILRLLVVEMVEKAGSGHIGMPLGFADVATVLYRFFIRFYPQDPTWAIRDRFILSAGHGSALLYALLYLNGYPYYTNKELHNFRKLNSFTPGHPEYNPNLGIEVTTGPLGQGLANAVGMAISSKIIGARLGSNFIYKVYAVVGDGCLMEGISHEALSLAGHLGLNNLIVLFDDNQISIDGPVSLSNSDLISTRMLSYNFNISSVDGHDPRMIYNSLRDAQYSLKPSFISYRTKIGYGSPSFQDNCKAHSSPFGFNEFKLIKERLGVTEDNSKINDNTLKRWRNVYIRNQSEYSKWDSQSQEQYKKILSWGSNPLSNSKKYYFKSNNIQDTRESSNKVLELLINKKNLLIGGSADLSRSNGTKVDQHVTINKSNYLGNYIHYGIREAAMVSIMNGMQVSGIRSYGGTFLVFSDYCRPSIRLAAMMKLPIILIMTHDGISAAEDGPTHQPVEHMSALRAIPNTKIYRPADAIETYECWQIMLGEKKSVSILCLTKYKVKQSRTLVLSKNLTKLGAYLIYVSNRKARVTIFASGSEVHIAIDVAKTLTQLAINTDVVSVPCQELFWKQSEKYRRSIISENSLKIAIEAGIKQSWLRIIGPTGLFFGITDFGKSASANVLYKHFGLTRSKIVRKIVKTLNEQIL